MECANIISLGVPKAFVSEVELIKKPEGAFDENGRWQVQKEFKPVKIKASVQPVSGKELEDVPEGRRAKEIIKMYTTYPLKTICPTDKVQPDILIYEGKKFELYMVQPWPSYFKAMGSLLERTKK